MRSGFRDETAFRSHVETRITNDCPLPLGFHWEDKGDGNALLQIAMPIETPHGRPRVIVAFPVGMPKPFLAKAIVRAKTIIGEIFDANMVAVVFPDGPRNGLVKPQQALLLPDSIALGRA